MFTRHVGLKTASTVMAVAGALVVGTLVAGERGALASLGCNPSVDHIELTQATQQGLGTVLDEPASTVGQFPRPIVELVDRRWTGVRVYVTEPNLGKGCGDANGDHYWDIGATFLVRSATNQLMAAGGVVWPPSKLEAPWKRAEERSTLNFYFAPYGGPYADRLINITVCVGQLSYYFDQSIPPKVIGYRHDSENCAMGDVPFHYKNQPRFYGIPVRYHDILPDDAIAESGDKMLWAIWPFPVEGQGGYTYFGDRKYTWVGDLTVNDFDDLNDKLTTRACNWTRQPKPDYMYGWLQHQEITHGGSASPGEDITSAHGGDGPDDGAFVYAHENGHNFNLQNHEQTHLPDEPLDQVGWDTATIIPSPNHVWLKPLSLLNAMHDSVAGLDNENFWVRQEQYTRVYNDKDTPNKNIYKPTKTCGQNAIEVEGPEISFFRVLGSVPASPSEMGHLDPTVEFRRSIEITGGTAGGGLLRTKSSSGATLFEVAFPLESGEETRFALVVPASPDVDSIQLYRDGALQDTLMRSDNAPEVSIDGPLPGAVLGSSVTVQWSASDADGGVLKSSVMYSDDDGASWMPLDEELSVTDLTIDSTDLPSSTAGALKVVVSDGMNTAEATVNGLQLGPNRIPTAQVVSPSNGDWFEPGTNVMLVGRGFDPEDGFLTSGSLVWASDRDGLIGQGQVLNTSSLRSGNHVITLRASDVAGASGTATVNISILAVGGP